MSFAFSSVCAAIGKGVKRRAQHCIQLRHCVSNFSQLVANGVGLEEVVDGHFGNSGGYNACTRYMELSKSCGKASRALKAQQGKCVEK